VKPWSAAALAVLAAGCARQPAAPPPSLLLVTIDTLRADHVGAYGAPAGATPQLDALAARGTLFEEAVASVPLTLPSHSTILSGLDPLHHGVRDNGSYVFPESVDTLPALLTRRGYATGAFVAAYVLDRRFGLARGFTAYDDRVSRKASGVSLLESERPCENVVEASRAWIKDQAGPFFAWAHFYEPHAPHVSSYADEVRTADACFGRLLQAAQAKAGEQLLVAVLADHGEGLGEHGEPGHGLFVYQSTLRIPLLLAGPRVARGERSKRLARTSDVLPTLLALLGVPAPAGLDGRDLLAGEAPREAYAESFYPASFGWSPLRSLRVGALKLVEAPRPELYDLAADPKETRDLAGARAVDVERLRGALQALLRTETRVAKHSSDPEVAERLRALGYAAGPGGDPGGARGSGKDPKDALPLFVEFERANALEARGEREPSLRAFRSLLAREPENGVFRRSLAGALRRRGAHAEAAAALGDLEKAGSSDATAWHERALALAGAGRIEQAIDAERRATALDPRAPEPFNHLGVLLAEKGRLPEALLALDQATRLDPTSAKAWSNRGNVLRGLRRFEEARTDYERASRLDPEDVEPINGLAVISIEQGRFDEAAAGLRSVLERRPEHHEARLNLAVVEAQRGNPTHARELAQVVAHEASGPLARRAREFLAILPH
jgi:arylsulfatase A-like enzyme/Flp pilus assembly protein TadD